MTDQPRCDCEECRERAVAETVAEEEHERKIEALFMPDGLEATLTHCGQRMKFKGKGFKWEGKPMEGFEITTLSYACEACLNKAEITLKELA